MNRQYLKSIRNNFSDSEYTRLKWEIIDICGISKHVWKNWMNGRTKIPKTAGPIIQKIVDEKLSNKYPNNSFQYILNF
ncbi:hypothetical protein FACS1894145_5740 [Bacteroidia bacterium]|nr:hypothetical protein FACS1894145_5740 [Bacteroidia bacterium]